MLETRDCNNEERILRWSSLKVVAGRLLKGAWNLIASILTDAMEVSGRIQL